MRCYHMAILRKALRPLPFLDNFSPQSQRHRVRSLKHAVKTTHITCLL